MLVMLWWVLAMAAGLCWRRWWTGVFTALSVVTMVLTQAGLLLHWAGWVQLMTLACTPWLLAAQRTRDETLKKRLHADEAQQMAHLSEAARSLLSLQTANQQAETHIAQITDVYHVTKDTARALHLAELFNAALTITPRLFSAQALRFIDLSDKTPHVLRATRLSQGRMALQDSNETTHPLVEMEQAIVNRARAGRKPSFAAVRALGCPAPEGVGYVAWAPLWREQKPIGVLVADELPEDQLPILSTVANQLSLQLSRIRLYEQVEALAVTDALTGLFVRTHFLERAREELARSKRHQLSCTLLMMDLDEFKTKNDTYGHLVGDVILKDVARLIQRNLREIDLLARYGGEEFILLLVETSGEHAAPVAQRLRQLIEVHPIRAYDELLSQTISIGLASFPDDAQTLEALIECADQALYAAKRAGRNCVTRWSTQTSV